MTQNQETITTDSDSSEQSIVDILIARQNEKRDRVNAIKQAMTAKHNEQTRFYLLMFKAVIAMTLIVVVGCLVADASAKHKSQPQIEPGALIQQLEKGEVVEMTVRAGEKP